MADASAYRVLEAVNIDGHEDMPGNLYFFVPPNYSGDVPSDQESIRGQLEDVAVVLRIAFQEDEPKLFNVFFRRLLVSAQGTFSTQGFRPEGIGDIDNFKREVVHEAGARIKSRYSMSLLKAVLVACVLLIIASIGLELLTGLGKHSPSETQDSRKPENGDAAKSSLENSDPNAFLSIGTVVRWNKSFSFMHTGILLSASMIGLFFAFMTRNIDPTFETIILPDADLMAPWVRLIFFGVPMLIIALIFQAKVITIELGEQVSTAQINENVVTAILVGLLLGIAERALPKEVEQWSKKLLPGNAASV